MEMLNRALAAYQNDNGIKPWKSAFNLKIASWLHMLLQQGTAYMQERYNFDSFIM